MVAVPGREDCAIGRTDRVVLGEGERYDVQACRVCALADELAASGAGGGGCERADALVHLAEYAAARVLAAVWLVTKFRLDRTHWLSSETRNATKELR